MRPGEIQLSRGQAAVHQDAPEARIVKLQRLLALLALLSGPGLTAFSQAPAGSPESHRDTTAARVPLRDFIPIEDRWRGIVPPPYELNDEGHWYDPYNQNILKGDYPLIGQNTFLVLTA